jgi:hypothetical protein
MRRITKKENKAYALELLKCYIWRSALYGSEKFDTSKSRSEIHGKF